MTSEFSYLRWFVSSGLTSQKNMHTGSPTSPPSLPRSDTHTDLLCASILFACASIVFRAVCVCVCMCVCVCVCVSLSLSLSLSL
jgi:hypothetical protein